MPPSAATPTRARGCRPRARRAAFPLAIALLALGCASGRSWTEGCPGVYSGVRFSRELRRDLPIDGKIFYGIDLPLTAVVDTLVLPATAFARPSPPPGGYPRGCHWAAGF